MRVVIQRVTKADVEIHKKNYASIHYGFCVLCAIHKNDTQKDMEWMAKKIMTLRICSDEDGKMNRNILEIEGELLLVSQFTLYGNIESGNRPSFTESARGDEAKKLFDYFVKYIRTLVPHTKVQTGIFASDMKISLINDGPVTLIIESKH